MITLAVDREFRFFQLSLSRSENCDGNDTIEADPDVTLPLWLYGGDGNNTLVGGAGNIVVVGGAGENTIHSSNGINTPQTVDDSDVAETGLADYFYDTGSWTSQTVAGAFNGEEQSHAESSGTDKAVWTFANLDPTAYYDVYVTWSPIAGASLAAQYSIYDGGTLLAGSLPAVNQQQAPADIQAAGAIWHDLGVFQATSGTLIVQLSTNSTDTADAVLADAAMIVPQTTAPVTNLTMDNFAVDANGNLSVTYTITGEDSPPFSIGIYGSPDGIQPTTLLQTYDVSDPSLLGGGGQTYTVSFAADLSGDSSPYLVAVLDVYNQVAETSKSDNLSAPLSGAFQNSDGGLYVMGSDGVNQDVAFSQDPSSGTTTVTIAGVAQQFTSVSSLYVSTGNGNDTVDASGVSVPLTAYAGSGNVTIIGGQSNNEIYGGAGFDTLNGSVGQNNWIQAGSGGGLITGGSGNDWLYAGTGGTTTIYGGSGTEVIHGGAGTNYIYGGSGLDEIDGGSGTNYIYGNGVHDVLQGGTGSNYILPASDTGDNLASLEVENAGNALAYGDGEYTYANPGNTPDDFTSDGNIDANGNPVQVDYDPGYGGVWNFNDLDSGVRLGEDTVTPVAVYATWVPQSQWESDARYTISESVEGHLVQLGQIDNIDQTASPGFDSPVPGDRPWKLLGVYDVSVGDTLTVTLSYDTADGGQDSTHYSPLCISDVMIHPLWPTVSIRATNVIVNPRAANAGEYVDWADACNPINIPVEGQGDRVPLQLQASIDPLYYDIANTTANDWHAILPNIAGLDFWDSANSTTPMAPDGNGDLIDQPLSGGSYGGTVYVSLDPTFAQTESGSSATPEQIAFHAKGVPCDADVNKVAKALQAKEEIVVSGFAPFTAPGGPARTVNYSQVIANQIKADNKDPNIDIKVVTVPVVWGEPGIAVRSVVQSYKLKGQQIELWLALGEARFFIAQDHPFATVESRAVNGRAQLPDNNKGLPPNPQIVPGGPPFLDLNPCPSAVVIAKSLGLTVTQRIQALNGSNGPLYLCNEMNYELLSEMLAEQNKSRPTLQNAVFMHVPEFSEGLPPTLKSQVDAWVNTFAKGIVQAVLQAIAPPKPRKKT